MWSVTVTDPETYRGFETEIHERFSRDHEAYPRDADLMLEVARKLGLHSVTIGGGRTPVPYADDEIVSLTLTGTVNSNDFRRVMLDIIRLGPGPETPVARHYMALARLREKPCRHPFWEHHWNEEYHTDMMKCSLCKVRQMRGLLWFDD